MSCQTKPNIWKNFLKINFKKLLTKGFESDIVNKLSRDRKQMRTLITEQWNTYTILENSLNETVWRDRHIQRTIERSFKTVKGIYKLVSLCWTWNKHIFWEFDPGSGWTLAACLTHASRTENCYWDLRMDLMILSGGRVSNAWITWPIQGDSSWKRLIIPHKRTVPHGTVWKVPAVWDGSASD